MATEHCNLALCSLYDIVHGEADCSELARIRAHAESCPRCRRFAAALSTIISSFAEL